MLNILFIYFNHYHDYKTLGFIYFVGLKMHRKPLVYADQCRVLDWTLQNKFGSSRVKPPVEDMWLRAKTAPDKYHTEIGNRKMGFKVYPVNAPPSFFFLFSFSIFWWLLVVALSLLHIVLCWFLLVAPLDVRLERKHINKLRFKLN